jgi:hypothetical protein
LPSRFSTSNRASELSAGAVQRTANRVADDETLCERTAVMRARRADREHFLARAHEHYALAVRVPEQHAAFFQIRARYPSLEIGTRQLVRTAHG